LTPEETETPVCPHCVRPFAPGADYCTYCGSGLGIAETQIQPIPIPNRAEFCEKHEPQERPARANWVRSVAMFWVVASLLSWGCVVLLLVVTLAFGSELPYEEPFLLPTMYGSLLIALVAALYTYRRARRSPS